MTERATFDVAIVGGGASGTLLAIQLLRRARAGWRLVLLDRAGDFARGIAYRTEEESHLLNVPAGRMSALPDEDGHFLAWLRGRDAGAGPETYAARRRYGDYLNELLAETELHAAPGVVLERRRAEVLGVENHQDGVLLSCAPGPDVAAHRAVLALGNPPPAPLAVSSAGTAAVWQAPWPRDNAWPSTHAAILLVGGGLTAVDWVLALSARGHQGPVHVLSRHGLLPHAHRTPTPKPLELQHLPRGSLRALMRTLRKASSQAADWRSAVDGVRPLSLELWTALSDKERRRFSRHLRTYWEVHRHRLAPQVASHVSDVQANGQLHMHAGRLLGLAASGARLEARYRPRGTSGDARLVVDLAINCTGPAGHALNADALVASLLRKEMARPGPLGLGLASDPRGALLDARGQASHTLWTLGPVRRGDAWESTAVPDIRLQAAALAEHLTQPAASSPSLG